MKRLAAFAQTHSRVAWGIVATVAITVGLLANELSRTLQEDEQLDLLKTAAERRGMEIMSQTLSGNLMGSVAMLGLVEEDIKREMRGEIPTNSPRIAGLFESVARAFDGGGMFLVAADGVIRSSWDKTGKTSTGLDVRFRPYFQRGMQGVANVYAAVSMTRGDRSLYFAAPIFAGTGKNGERIGVVVARNTADRLDTLMQGKADIALLLSPQGVVFASNHKEWISFLAGAATPERLKAIRDLKQFGGMFEKATPSQLPMTVADGFQTYQGRRYAVASAPIEWNDPAGQWHVVLMNDLSHTLPVSESLRNTLGAGLLVLLLAALMLKLLRSRQAQNEATQRVEAYAREQEASAARKTRMAAVAVAFQQAQDLPDLGRTFFAEAHALLGALQGVMYVVAEEPDSPLRLMASYGCDGEVPAELSPGEGLLGQCLVEQQLQVFDSPGAGFWKIRSGLGGALPTALLVAPVVLKGAVLGAVELAVLDRPDPQAQERFGEMIALLAMNVEILRRSQRTEDMLLAAATAEHAKAEQLAFQQVLVDTIPYPVFYKGADSRYLGFNRAYEETFAVNRTELIGKRVLDLDYLPEADRRAYQAEDEATIASAGTVKREMRIPFADGKLHETLYFVSGFRRPDGSPGGLVGTFIDISAMKNAERELDRLADIERINRLTQGREQRILDLKREVNDLARELGRETHYKSTDMDAPLADASDVVAEHGAPQDEGIASPHETFVLGDLVDLGELQTLLTRFCESVGVAAAIIDLEGKVLASARWQRVCTDFHRVNAESCARCIESDTQLAMKLQDGSDFTIYTCRNGMTDCASPIVVESRHLANVFIGQFHLAPPDPDFFAGQARQFGYAEDEYLKAVNEAPVIDENRLPTILGFLVGFARIMATMSLSRRRADDAQRRLEQQAVTLRRERLTAMSLAEDAARIRHDDTAQSLESQS